MHWAAWGKLPCEPLLKLLAYHKMHVRIGAIEALSEIKSPRSVDPLIQTLTTDEDHEVRWVAALALGEIGDKRAIPSLLSSLRDKDRYVRYGSAKALEQLGWSASTDQEQAYYFIGLQDWKALHAMGIPAVGPLIETLREKNPSTRAKIVELLGEMRTDDAKKACETALGDPDPSSPLGSHHRLQEMRDHHNPPPAGRLPASLDNPQPNRCGNPELLLLWYRLPFPPEMVWLPVIHVLHDHHGLCTTVYRGSVPVYLCLPVHLDCGFTLILHGQTYARFVR